MCNGSTFLKVRADVKSFISMCNIRRVAGIEMSVFAPMIALGEVAELLDDGEVRSFSIPLVNVVKTDSREWLSHAADLHLRTEYIEDDEDERMLLRFIGWMFTPAEVASHPYDPHAASITFTDGVTAGSDGSLVDFLLPDVDADGQRRGAISGHVLLGTQGLEIFVEGYGGGAAMPKGSPIFLEHYDGKLVLRVHGDVNQEDPTHQIELEAAREDKRGVINPTPLMENVRGLGQGSTDYSPLFHTFKLREF